MDKTHQDDNWVPDPEQMKDQGMARSAGSALEQSLLEMCRQAMEEYRSTQSAPSASTTQQSSTKEA